MDQMRRLITTWDKIHEIIDEAMRRHFHTASVRIGRWHVLLAQTFLRAMTSVPLPSFSLYPMVLLE